MFRTSWNSELAKGSRVEGSKDDNSATRYHITWILRTLRSLDMLGTSPAQGASYTVPTVILSQSKDDGL
jgi:hypothetical protein